MDWREVLDIDRSHELKSRTWWWWWFIFFFTNPANPLRTKQMVVLWGTRNCRRLVINDRKWTNHGRFVRSNDGIEAEGVAAGWYFDGDVMHDPLFVDDGKLNITWSGGGGTLSVKSSSTYLLDVRTRPYQVNVERPDTRIAMNLEKWTDSLDGIVPTGKDYLGYLGYKMRKVRGSRAEGTIESGGKREVVSGTAYFQNVRINSPTSPWYWGIFQSDKGSYIDYFLPHLGPPALRRTAHHESGLDWGEKMLSKGWQFLDGDTGDLHRLKRIAISKRYESDLPIFSLSGEDGVRKVKMEMAAYARAYWKIEQPLIGPITTILYYNEYPANVTEFEFSEGSREWTLSDLGSVVGNCEHSWGIV